MLILVTGGAGSGKSLLAERISMQLKCMPFWYVATMQVWDQECRDRIDRHRRQRAGKGFQTVEAPVHWRKRQQHCRRTEQHCWNV